MDTTARELLHRDGSGGATDAGRRRGDPHTLVAAHHRPVLARVGDLDCVVQPAGDQLDAEGVPRHEGGLTDLPWSHLEVVLATE